VARTHQTLLVEFDGRPNLCSQDGTTATIKFLRESGDLPPIVRGDPSFIDTHTPAPEGAVDPHTQLDEQQGVVCCGSHVCVGVE